MTDELCLPAFVGWLRWMGGDGRYFGPAWENDRFSVFDGHCGFYVTMDIC